MHDKQSITVEHHGQADGQQTCQISVWGCTSPGACPPCVRYWYPLAYFQSLALQPTALIGLNEELKPPKLDVQVQF